MSVPFGRLLKENRPKRRELRLSEGNIWRENSCFHIARLDSEIPAFSCPFHSQALGSLTIKPPLQCVTIVPRMICYQQLLCLSRVTSYHKLDGITRKTFCHHSECQKSQRKVLAGHTPLKTAGHNLF